MNNHQILTWRSKVFYTLSFSLLSFASCSLDEYNPGGATVESLLNTPEGIEAATNGTYTYNQKLYGKEQGYALLEMGTDIWTGGANSGNSGTNGIYPQPTLMNYQGLISDNVWVKSNLWQPCYAGINLVNTALKNIGTAGVEAAKAPILEAELRFMRAWYYWHLVESFGDIPFTLEPTESIVTIANRTPVDQVYEQIFSDLQYAVDNAPSNNTDYGKITKPIAEAFSARVYLTRGRYEEALTYAQHVMNNYGYSLMPNYADLWKMDNEKNGEIIWGLNYSTNLEFNDGSNVGHSMYLMEYDTQPGMLRDVANGFPNVRYMPTKFLLNLFDETKDVRFNSSFKTTWFCNETDAAKRPEGMALGDTAIFCSKYAISSEARTGKVYKIYDINDVYRPDGTPADRFHYISLKKFEDPTRASAAETESARDVFLIRLPEMYFIAAEAEMQRGNNTAAAGYINTIRERAAINSANRQEMDITASMVTLDFILDERAREFAGEQLRWFDLKRTNKLLERVQLHNPDAKSFIKDFHMIRPIPQSELDAVTNKDTFKQNPGY
ncbi:RagB/SusD family nutrient uptake outer membrane protein [Olivibacter domesticus]|uniref:Starch-binding associating with outer membrane n=1 Tax=Olivibacter domesticus TaxID=407022 RepID=A0A1H7MHY4_OLID1|nr:RagB/SusD family nutrient uptake outer membrane protein [Olivibacter domesticus]SEL10896.1 Starch-binding associating with outer membrane [Olivibacter domesticus]